MEIYCNMNCCNYSLCLSFPKLQEMSFFNSTFKGKKKKYLLSKAVSQHFSFTFCYQAINWKMAVWTLVLFQLRNLLAFPVLHLFNSDIQKLQSLKDLPFSNWWIKFFQSYFCLVLTFIQGFFPEMTISSLIVFTTCWKLLTSHLPSQRYWSSSKASASMKVGIWENWVCFRGFNYFLNKRWENLSWIELIELKT